MGFLNAKEKNERFSDKKDKNDEYKPGIMMPNVRNVNNFVGVKNSFFKSLPKNLILDKVL